MKIRPDIPITNNLLTPENMPKYLKMLRDCDAKRFWIAPSREDFFSHNRTEAMETLRRQVAYFKENGIETGIWITVVGFGGDIKEKNIPWTRLRSVSGIHWKTADLFCPEDPDFWSAMLQYIRELAALGADLIMLDDEFCLSHPGIGCFCDRHLRLMSEKLGEEVTMDGLPERIFTGGKNKYRDAWFQGVGDTLRMACRSIRQAVDEVAPSVRVGLCAGKTHWDIEGTDALEMVKLLAGNTKPFLRLMGAPYWVACDIHNWPGQRLNGVIETARMQIAWCENEDVEIFAEADSFPRPRYHVNGSLIEQFDIAMRAEGIPSLKYVLDYTAQPEYETGYMKMHLRNVPLYRHVEEVFENKRSAGVRMFCPMHTVQNAVFPDFFLGEAEIIRFAFPLTANFLTGVGVPVCYSGDAECGAAFGEDAHAIEDPASWKKLIVDLSAAKILQEKGVDVGIQSTQKMDVSGIGAEIFPEGTVSVFGFGVGGSFAAAGGVYRTELKAGAEVLSRFPVGTEEIPASYRYHNGTTDFLVLAFDARAVGESSSVAISYYRQKQIMDFVGKRYPYIRKEPEIYTICTESEDGGKQAVLFENLSRDPVFDFDIEIGKGCKEFRLFGAEGVLSEDRTRIHVTTEFAPSAAMVLEVDAEEEKM